MRRWLLIVGLTALVAACAATTPPAPARPSSGAMNRPAVSGPPTGITSQPAPPTASPAASAKLVLSATGLGPCHQPWWSPCVYGIRVEGPGGYDHRGSFGWDPGPPPSGEMGMGTAGPVSSTGVLGDVPTTLGPGTWTLSFRLYYDSDAVSFNPVPGGTPRYAWEDPFTAACLTDVTVAGQPVVHVHVAFADAKCDVRTTDEANGARLTLDATGLGPCPVTFPMNCVYLIRIDGADGYEHYGWFVWNDGKRPSASIWVAGDVPASLPAGTWTFSFGRTEVTDVISFIPVPGATPRTEELRSEDVGCTTSVTVGDEISVGLHVAFKDTACTVTGEAAIP
jgi:hypothetical protein